MSRIKGQFVCITGASAGIGKACAEKFASLGANLILLARRKNRLNELKKEIEAGNKIFVQTFEVDVRERTQVEKFAGTLEKEKIIPDVLINNAGLASGLSKIQDGEFSDWDAMIDTNVKGLLNITRMILPMMIKRNSGHIVNLGSVAGWQTYPKGNVYNATKFAVRALSEATNLDLLETKIRVTNISPGLVETEFSDVRFHDDTQRAKKVYQGYQPLAPEDVADAIAYAVNVPEHVSINEITILPTAQRNAYLLDRKKS